MTEQHQMNRRSHWVIISSPKRVKPILYWNGTLLVNFPRIRHLTLTTKRVGLTWLMLPVLKSWSAGLKVERSWQKEHGGTELPTSWQSRNQKTGILERKQPYIFCKIKPSRFLTYNVLATFKSINLMIKVNHHIASPCQHFAQMHLLTPYVMFKERRKSDISMSNTMELFSIQQKMF